MPLRAECDFAARQPPAPAALILAQPRYERTANLAGRDGRASVEHPMQEVVQAMYDRHPDVSDEDLGIRAFQIKRAKAVERAIERLRHGLGDSWKDLTGEEIEEIEWVFGELWAYVARAEWDELRFGRLTVSDVIKILTLGSQMRRHARPSIEVLREVEQLVKDDGATSSAAESPA